VDLGLGPGEHEDGAAALGSGVAWASCSGFRVLGFGFRVRSKRMVNHSLGALLDADGTVY